nr:hypothetical protein [Tanacetum cinerariifolium]
MRIPVVLLNEDIMQTNAYKVYDVDFTKENVKILEQHLLDEDVNKIVEGDDSNAIEFADSLLLSQENPDTKIDPGSDKERPEAMNVDYVATVEEDEESAEAALIRGKGKSSMEVRDTPIAKPTRSPRINLSSDKDQLQELTTSLAPSFEVPPQSSAKHLRQLQGALARMRRRHANENYMNNLIVWESRYQDLTRQVPDDTASVYVGCERDVNTLARYLYSKDIFFLKHRNTKARKYVLSLHKFHATSFLEDDVEEVLTRWVAKQDQIQMKSSQNRKIIEIIRGLYHETYEQYLIEEVYVKQADDKAYFFLESNFKELPDYSQSYCSNHYIYDIKTLPLYSIIADPFVGIVYENSKKEKRAMNINELQKFYDATLKRVLKED